MQTPKECPCEAKSSVVEEDLHLVCANEACVERLGCKAHLLCVALNVRGLGMTRSFSVFFVAFTPQLFF